MYLRTVLVNVLTTSAKRCFIRKWLETTSTVIPQNCRPVKNFIALLNNVTVSNWTRAVDVDSYHSHWKGFWETIHGQYEQEEESLRRLQHSKPMADFVWAPDFKNCDHHLLTNTDKKHNSPSKTHSVRLTLILFIFHFITTANTAC